MKQFLIFFLSFFIASFLFAQSIERQLIGVSNGNLNSTDIHIEWSVGETFIDVQQTDIGFLTEGFIQPDILETPGLRIGLDFSFEAYPNPVNEALTLNLEEINEEDFYIRIFDLTGRLARNEIFASGSLQKELSMAGLKPGLYLIQLIDEKGVLKGMVKIVKIND